MYILKALILASVISLGFPAATSAQQTSGADVPMIFRGTMPAVEIMVNGKGPFVFAIDTGAQGFARADTSLVRRLDLKTIEQTRASDPSGKNIQTLDVVKIDSISIGNLEFRDLKAPTRDYNLGAHLPAIDGILGFNLFSEYILTLDFPAQRVRIERGQLPKSDGVAVLDFEVTTGIPIVELRIGNLKVRSHIDSGNTIGRFVLPSSIVEKLTLASQPITVGKARTISNEVEIKEVRLKDSVWLGGFEFKEPAISFPAISDFANIGSRTLRDFVITFDQKNKRLRLEKREPARVEDAPTGNVPPEFLNFIGRYGERTISFDDGKLCIQRPGGPKLKLVSISKDEFALEQIPAARLKFFKDANGKITELHVLNQAGQWETSKKE